MAFKLKIADKIGVKVKGTTVDEKGADRAFSFTLYCDRLAEKKLKEVILDRDTSAHNFFEQHAHGWKDQDLVVDEATGQAADFSQEALAALFEISGMATVCWQAYLQQALATAKN
jgi:hypothetical protein